MQTVSATAAGSSGVPSEDRFATGPNWAFVVDGAGRYPGRTGGCVHPVVWIVDRLTSNLAAELRHGDDRILSQLLAAAITATGKDHGETCDLTDPLSPGATVAILRERGNALEWLVLGDCAAVIDSTEYDPMAIIDDRVDRLPGAPITDGAVRTYHPDYVAQVRNREGGFWVAGAVPEAAAHAYAGLIATSIVRQAMLATDGVTRLVERHGWTWRQVLDTATQAGPQALIEAVRRADATDPDPRRWRGKDHDDATVVRVLCGEQAS